MAFKSFLALYDFCAFARSLVINNLPYSLLHRHHTHSYSEMLWARLLWYMIDKAVQVSCEVFTESKYYFSLCNSPTESGNFSAIYEAPRVGAT